MSLEEKLRAAAREATGDESILDVAEFHPRGFAAAAGAGAGAGSVVGGGVTDSGLGSAVGAAGGTAAGMAAASAARGLPMRIGIAVSPELVYLAEIEGVTSVDSVSVFAQLDRKHTAVEVHGRAMNRVVILEDEKTGETYEMEAPRVGPFHAKALVELLMLSEPHLETQTSET